MGQMAQVNRSVTRLLAKDKFGGILKRCKFDDYTEAILLSFDGRILVFDGYSSASVFLNEFTKKQVEAAYPRGIIAVVPRQPSFGPALLGGVGE